MFLLFFFCSFPFHECIIPDKYLNTKNCPLFLGTSRYLKFQQIHCFIFLHLLSIITVLIIIQNALLPLSFSTCLYVKIPFIEKSFTLLLLGAISHGTDSIEILTLQLVLPFPFVSTFPYLYSFFCKCFWLRWFLLHSCLASLLY